MTRTIYLLILGFGLARLLCLGKGSIKVSVGRHRCLPSDGVRLNRQSIAASQAELIGQLDRLAPFGAANAEPRFVFPGVRVIHAEPVGSGHLRCILADPLDAARLRAIAFRAVETPLGQFLAETRGAAIHVAGHLRRDSWRGGDAVQLLVDDASPAITKNVSDT